MDEMHKARYGKRLRAYLLSALSPNPALVGFYGDLITQTSVVNQPLFSPLPEVKGVGLKVLSLQSHGCVP